MASSLKVGGYQCKFIDEVPDYLLCKSCRHVARQPHLTSCCGEHYCHTCIAPIMQDKKPCPSCKEDTFTIFLDKRDQRKILALRVCCVMKDRGCQWTGKVEQLDTHTDDNTGDCQYVEVECPEKCGQQVQKHQLTTHIADKCPKRDLTCMHCGFKATYEVVSEKHWPECQNYPVPCPNRCQIGAVERNILEDHLNMCSLQVIECDFSYAGCSEKLQRQDMEKHIEENTQKHLALMAAAIMKMNREFEKKLQEQRDEFLGYLEQKERETVEQLNQKDEQIKVVEEQLQQLVREKEEQIKSMQKTLQKEHEKQIKALKEQIVQVKEDHEKSLEVQSQQQAERIGKLEKQLKEREQELEQLNMKVQVGVPPFHFTMSNFNHLKTERTWWDSPPMYTHAHGYKFCIGVLPYRYGSNVTVDFHSMSGEFDATLQWPAKFTITLQLLNQHRDHDHITVTRQLQWNKPESEREQQVYFTATLLAQSDLELNAQKQTQYLKDDCLRFHITKVEALK